VCPSQLAGVDKESCHAGEAHMVRNCRRPLANNEEEVESCQHTLEGAWKRIFLHLSPARTVPQVTPSIQPVRDSETEDPRYTILDH
jgi:hypothetical protein